MHLPPAGRNHSGGIGVRGGAIGASAPSLVQQGRPCAPAVSSKPAPPGAVLRAQSGAFLLWRRRSHQRSISGRRRSSFEAIASSRLMGSAQKASREAQTKRTPSEHIVFRSE